MLELILESSSARQRKQRQRERERESSVDGLASSSLMDMSLASELNKIATEEEEEQEEGREEEGEEEGSREEEEGDDELNVMDGTSPTISGCALKMRWTAMTTASLVNAAKSA